MTDPTQPPHNEQAEAALVGGLMYSSDYVADVMAILEPGDFYKPAYGHIYTAVLDLFVSGNSPEIVAVGELLKSRGLLDACGGAPGIMALLNYAGAPSGLIKLAEIIRGHSVMRKLSSAGAEIKELGLSSPEDPDAVVNAAEELLFSITEHKVRDSVVPASSALSVSLDRLDTLLGSGEMVGTPTGYLELDKMTSGLQPGQLVVVGARPSMGKTAFATGLAYFVSVVQDLPVLLFSLEMSSDELVSRMWASEGLVPIQSLKNGNLMEEHWDSIYRVTGQLSQSPLWIDDNSTTTISDIRAKCRKFKSRHGKLGLIVVDYLQLMTGRKGAENRQVEVSEISRGLKILARDLETPVIALSQLSRGLEARMDKRPMLSDLRESGSIEQDADTVIFLYRDEIYVEDSEFKGTAEVIVAKQRSGPTGRFRMGFLGSCTRFVNLASG